MFPEIGLPPGLPATLSLQGPLFQTPVKRDPRSRLRARDGGRTARGRDAWIELRVFMGNAFIL